MISEDEYLERVVAGIHAASSADADVCWNEVINGRQFDGHQDMNEWLNLELSMMGMKPGDPAPKSSSLDPYPPKSAAPVASGDAGKPPASAPSASASAPKK